MSKRNSIDHTTMREMNIRLILNTLRLYSPLSRAKVAAHTGLNKTSVSNMVNELIQLEEIAGRDYMIKNRKESKSMAATYGGLYPASSPYPRYNNNFNTEGYASINENGYKNVKHN